MKYANVYYPNGTTGRNKKKGKINIGDSFQWLAIQNIYQLMGIDEREILQIPKDELGTYSGEAVICPINFLHANYINKDRMFPFSAQITPVFLGLSLGDVYLHDDEIAYLKKYEPIGCRDEDTCKRLQEWDIDAYINGCLTTTFSERISKSGDKIYFVDVPANVWSYVPEEIRVDCVKRSALIENDSIDDISHYVSELYKEYREEAKLVVTSRLHVAVPCWAAGIPVIMIAEEFSYTYSWIEKIIPFYLCSEIDEIDWGKVKNQSNNLDIKNLIIQIALQRIMAKKINREQINKLNDYWNTREKLECVHTLDNVYNELKRNFKGKSEITYCFWAYTPMAETIYQYILEKYPQAKLKAFFDRDKQGCFHEIRLCSLDEMANYINCYMIICGFTACMNSNEILSQIGWEPDKILKIYSFGN